jgi:hypothetical protein
MTMKTCTHCNETVRATARKCQFCGFRFDVTAAKWPAAMRTAALIVLGAGAAIGLVSPVLAVPQLVAGGALFAIGSLGARATRKAQFRSTGAVPALRVPHTDYCCPACSPAA